MATELVAPTSPVEFAEIVEVLNGFALTTADLIDAGDNESRLAARLNHAFRMRGWRESARVLHSDSPSSRTCLPGEHGEKVRATEVKNEGYKVDNIKGRIALDVEWNAKDGKP